jgi:uncharacterized membrane protein YozB (DUF420 family)
MDLIVFVTIGVLPFLTWSLMLVRQRQYAAHKRLQLSIGSTLVLAVLLFEIDIRLHDWRQDALASPYYDTWLFPFLAFHVVIAATTFILWVTTLYFVWRRMPSPPGPSPHSALHRRLGKLTALGTYCSAVTGWTFYWLAFLAS